MLTLWPWRKIKWQMLLRSYLVTITRTSLPKDIYTRDNFILCTYNSGSLKEIHLEWKIHQTMCYNPCKMMTNDEKYHFTKNYEKAWKWREIYQTMCYKPMCARDPRRWWMLWGWLDLEPKIRWILLKTLHAFISMRNQKYPSWGVWVTTGNPSVKNNKSIWT